MSADRRHGIASIEQLQLQTRAAHIYLDAIPDLADAARRGINRMQAVDVLHQLECFLAQADASGSTRSRVEAWRDGLRDRLAQMADQG